MPFLFLFQSPRGLASWRCPLRAGGVERPTWFASKFFFCSCYHAALTLYQIFCQMHLSLPGDFHKPFCHERIEIKCMWKMNVKRRDNRLIDKAFPLATQRKKRAHLTTRLFSELLAGRSSQMWVAVAIRLQQGPPTPCPALPGKTNLICIQIFLLQLLPCSADALSERPTWFASKFFFCSCYHAALTLYQIFCQMHLSLPGDFHKPFCHERIEIKCMWKMNVKRRDNRLIDKAFPLATQRKKRAHLTTRNYITVCIFMPEGVSQIHVLRLTWHQRKCFGFLVALCHMKFRWSSWRRAWGELKEAQEALDLQQKAAAEAMELQKQEAGPIRRCEKQLLKYWTICIPL